MNKIEVFLLFIGTCWLGQAQFTFNDTLYGNVKYIKEYVTYNNPLNHTAYRIDKENLPKSEDIHLAHTDSLFFNEWYTKTRSPLRRVYKIYDIGNTVIQEKWYDHTINYSFINDYIFNKEGDILYSELKNTDFKPFASYKHLEQSHRFDKKYYWYYNEDGRLKEEYEEDFNEEFYRKKYHYTSTGYIQSVVYGQNDKIIWSKSTFYENDLVKKTVSQDRSGAVPIFKINYYSYDKNSLTTETAIMDGELEVEQNKIVTALDELGNLLSKEIYDYNAPKSNTPDLDLKEEYLVNQDTVITKKVEKGVLQAMEKKVFNKDGSIVYYSHFNHLENQLISQLEFNYNLKNQVEKITVTQYSKATQEIATYTISIKYTYDKEGNWIQQTKLVDQQIVGTLKRRIEYDELVVVR